MTKIFTAQPGQVHVVDLGGGAPGVLSVTGEGGRLSRQEGVIITSIGVGQQVNAQFTPSLEKVIYVYSFGDRMGQITVNGVAFDKTCRDKRGYLGARSIFSYYDKSRAVEEDRIMKVSIGGKTFQGYLTSMDLRTSSPELKLMGFTLSIVTIPKQVGL
jgi:hypothetical protein